MTEGELLIEVKSVMRDAGERIIALVKENEALEAEVEVCGFKVANLTTERDVAWQEIERLKEAASKSGLRKPTRRKR